MRHAKAAESLIETLIAITVIVLATTAALSVLRTSQAGNEVIGKKVIAINIAMEGFEALRNLRDTNYLLFASDPDNCWNKLEMTDVSDCTDASTPANTITDGYNYYLTRDFASTSTTMFAWNLTRLTNTSTQGYLSMYDLDWDSNTDWESQIYAQSTGTGVATSDMRSLVANRSLFQRIITIDSPSGSDYYDATITVHWYDNGVRQTISLTRSIAHVY